jgi:Skp family chaperone for outer membrane proteins
MKKTHWIALTIGIVIVLGICAAPAITQTQPQPAAAPQATPTPVYVAVMDVAKVMKMHPVFMEQQGALQKEIAAAEATFKTRQEKIEGQRKSLEASQLKADTPEYQKMLDDIAGEMANFERDARAMQRKFALQNSKIMYETYQDIKKTIEAFALANGIAQVTDYREFVVDPADPATVAEDMDQRLVWFNSNLNITDKIIKTVYTARGLNPPAPGTVPPAIGPAGAAPAATANQAMPGYQR